MKLTKREDSANYAATVINLPVKQKVEGLDNLVKVTVFGNDVLVSKDEDETLMYLFFPSGTQLSPEFCRVNNLYRESQLNIDPQKKGFFELNGRVKALKLRGVISTGFVIPAIDSLYNLRESFPGLNISVGDEFTDIDEINICKKYIPVGTRITGTPTEKKQKNKLTDLLIPNQFRFHEETSHLAKNLHVFSPDDIIAITDKWHGSSCILSKVLILKELTLWQKFLNLLGANIPAKEIGYIYSSGKPKSHLPKNILTSEGESVYKSSTGDYYSSDIYKRAFDDYKHTLEDGISIYGELVGFTLDGASIQKGYDYGCKAFSQKGEIIYHDRVEQSPPFYRLMIYRITYTKPDGNKIEFSWQQIKDYCTKYSLEYAKEFYFGNANDFVRNWLEISGETSGDDIFKAISRAEFNLEKDDKYCINKVPAEGIVVRIDGRESFMAYKLKSKKFLKKEDEELDKGEVNMEDSQ